MNAPAAGRPPMFFGIREWAAGPPTSRNPKERFTCLTGDLSGLVLACGGDLFGCGTMRNITSGKKS